jgi:hypothetical protein
MNNLFFSATRKLFKWTDRADAAIAWFKEELEKSLVQRPFSPFYHYP